MHRHHTGRVLYVVISSLLLFAIITNVNIDNLSIIYNANSDCPCAWLWHFERVQFQFVSASSIWHHYYFLYILINRSLLLIVWCDGEIDCSHLCGYTHTHHAVGLVSENKFISLFLTLPPIFNDYVFFLSIIVKWWQRNRNTYIHFTRVVRAGSQHLVLASVLQLPLKQSKRVLRAAREGEAPQKFTIKMNNV